MNELTPKRGRKPRAEPFQPHRISASLTRGLVRELDVARGESSRTRIVAVAVALYLAVQRGEASIVWVDSANVARLP